MFVYFGERENVSRGGADRVGDTEPEAGTRLRAISTDSDVGLQFTNCEIVTRAEVGCLTNWATQAPCLVFSFFLSLFILRESAELKWGGAEREGERKKFPSRLCTARRKPDPGLKPTNHSIMTWAKSKSRTLNQISHPGTLKFSYRCNLRSLNDRVSVATCIKFVFSMKPSRAAVKIVSCLPTWNLIWVCLSFL